VSLDTSSTTEPYLTGIYEPVTDEREDVGLTVMGEIPQALRGSYLRNGSNPQFSPLGRYHVFDGDGMIHAVDLADGQATYRNRWVDSRGLLVERREGQALYGGLSEFVLPAPEVTAEGGIVKNTANTNIIRHAGRRLALMEAAAPTELRADLSTVGEFTFDDRLDGPMTAHPRIDPATGAMHFFGWSPFAPYLRYHVVDANGTLVHSTVIELERSVMIHDFVITESSVVFFDLPAVFDVERMMSGHGGTHWRGDLPARIGVMPLGGDGAQIRWIEIDPCYVFHFVNAHDTADGRIVVDGCRASAMPTSFGDDPMPGPEVKPSLHRWLIDPVEGDAVLTQLDDRGADFPRINDAYTGRDQRWSYLGHVGSWNDEEVIFDGVTVFDRAGNTWVDHVYGTHHASGEAVFAADPNGSAENDGWLLNFVTDLTDRSSRLVILDAHDVTQGPVAEVLLPRRVPSGFHGNWLPEPA